jgi:pimeloyl-ACP methyl ester carboxylesterase
LNFNNESGYLTANWDIPISYTFTADGTKTISFRLTYTDGTNYTSRTKVIMHGSSIQKAPIDLTRYDTYPIPLTSEYSGGTLQIYYAKSNNTSPRKFRKTLIVAEGFDPSSVMGPEYSMDIADFIDNNTGGIDVYFYNSSLGYYTSLQHGLDINNYDIVYVDNTDGVDDIRRNAKVFEEAIKYVNKNKAGDFENVVMGISMGGLVARYALRKMEIAGKDHKACKYISVDSPHKGANVPVGAQALIRHVENIDFNLFWFITVYNATQIDDNIGAAVKLLNSKATKQLLMYNVTKDFTYDNSDHDTFMAEYESLGVPQKCQNIAIANGSNNGTKFFDPQTELININETVGLKWWQEILNVVLGQLSYTTLLTNYPQLYINVIPGKTEIAASIVAKALPDRSVQNVYDGRIFLKKKILWLIPVEVDITHKTLNSTNDMLPVDGAPGGSYNVSNIGVSGSYSKYLKQSSFCFIPTVSAIGLSNWKDRLTTPFNNTNFYAFGLSPFRYYFAQSNNEYHTQFDSPATFLYNHFISSCIIPDELENDIYIQNLTISSDRYFRGRNIYIGNNVTTSVPQGNVLINNGAKVIFNGKTVVFDKGFECINGSTYETTNH